MYSTEKNYWENFYKTNSVVSKPSDYGIFISEYFKNYVGLKILDAGCGNGRDSYFLSEYHNVTGVDISVNPEDSKNVNFIIDDFCDHDKEPYDVVYSRFTFHSIDNSQQNKFLESIRKKGTYLCIECRSDKSVDEVRHHGDDHYRNFVNSDHLKSMLNTCEFDILYFEEQKDFAKYKDENPICIRTICIKR